MVVLIFTGRKIEDFSRSLSAEPEGRNVKFVGLSQIQLRFGIWTQGDTHFYLFLFNYFYLSILLFKISLFKKKLSLLIK